VREWYWNAANDDLAIHTLGRQGEFLRP
jgi:hypothetical protein